jgi:hypothetical protein
VFSVLRALLAFVLVVLYIGIDNLFLALTSDTTYLRLHFLYNWVFELASYVSPYELPEDIIDASEGPPIR